MNESAFDLTHQNQSVDAKIVAGLERIATTFRVLLWQQSRDTSLSPMQLQILLFLATHEPQKGKVGYLANEFNLTKPTISDAVKSLAGKGLIDRKNEPTDSRSHTLHLTETGRQMAGQTANFAQLLQELVSQLDAPYKQAMFESRFTLIYNLQQRGVITVQRMCTTCLHYDFTGQLHFCNLLQIPLEATQLRLDCLEHQPVVS